MVLVAALIPAINSAPVPTRERSLWAWRPSCSRPGSPARPPRTRSPARSGRPCGDGVGDRGSAARPRRRDQAIDPRCAAHGRVRRGRRDGDRERAERRTDADHRRHRVGAPEPVRERRGRRSGPRSPHDRAGRSAFGILCLPVACAIEAGWSGRTNVPEGVTIARGRRLRPASLAEVSSRHSG